ncbi:hypothetical protein HK102_002885, partial [Quaeritorhiza haematococci]
MSFNWTKALKNKVTRHMQTGRKSYRKGDFRVVTFCQGAGFFAPPKEDRILAIDDLHAHVHQGYATYDTSKFGDTMPPPPAQEFVIPPDPMGAVNTSAANNNKSGKSKDTLSTAVNSTGSTSNGHVEPAEDGVPLMTTLTTPPPPPPKDTSMGSRPRSKSMDGVAGGASSPNSPSASGMTIQDSPRGTASFDVYRGDADRTTGGVVDNFKLFAVFDGHCGAIASSFLQYRFPFELCGCEAFKRGDYEQAMRDTYAILHKELLLCDKYGPEKPTSDFSAGSTATVALVTPHVTYFAYLGDSPVIVWRRSQERPEMVFEEHDADNLIVHKNLMDSNIFLVLVRERVMSVVYYLVTQKDIKDRIFAIAAEQRANTLLEKNGGVDSDTGSPDIISNSSEITDADSGVMSPSDSRASNEDDGPAISDDSLPHSNDSTDDMFSSASDSKSSISPSVGSSGSLTPSSFSQSPSQSVTTSESGSPVPPPTPPAEGDIIDLKGETSLTEVLEGSDRNVEFVSDDEINRDEIPVQPPEPITTSTSTTTTTDPSSPSSADPSSSPTTPTSPASNISDKDLQYDDMRVGLSALNVYGTLGDSTYDPEVMNAFIDEILAFRRQRLAMYEVYKERIEKGLGSESSVRGEGEGDGKASGGEPPVPEKDEEKKEEKKEKSKKKKGKEKEKEKEKDADETSEKDKSRTSTIERNSSQASSTTDSVAGTSSPAPSSPHPPHPLSSSFSSASFSSSSTSSATDSASSLPTSESTSTVPTLSITPAPAENNKPDTDDTNKDGETSNKDTTTIEECDLPPLQYSPHDGTLLNPLEYTYQDFRDFVTSRPIWPFLRKHVSLLKKEETCSRVLLASIRHLTPECKLTQPGLLRVPETRSFANRDLRLFVMGSDGVIRFYDQFIEQYQAMIMKNENNIERMVDQLKDYMKWLRDD